MELEDATKELKRSLEETEKAKKTWKDTFDNVPDVITIHDKEFNILYANKNTEEVLGISLDEIVTQKRYKTYYSTDKQATNCHSCKVLDTQKYKQSELFEPSFNTWLEIRAVPRFENDEFVGLIHVVIEGL